jgi:hypothetical protein
LRLSTPTRRKRQERLSRSDSRAIRFFPRRTVATTEPRHPRAAVTPGGRPSLPSIVIRTRPRLIRLALAALRGRRPLGLGGCVAVAAGVAGAGGAAPGGATGSTGASGPIAATRTSADGPELPVSHAATPTWSGATAARSEPMATPGVCASTVPERQVAPSSEVAWIRCRPSARPCGKTAWSRPEASWVMWSWASSPEAASATAGPKVVPL